MLFIMADYLYQLPFIWLRLELDSVVVCSSCVDNEGKATLSKEVQALGGRLVNTWSQECTHLVMPAVKVTIKVRNTLA